MHSVITEDDIQDTQTCKGTNRRRGRTILCKQCKSSKMIAYLKFF